MFSPFDCGHFLRRLRRSLSVDSRSNHYTVNGRVLSFLRWCGNLVSMYFGDVIEYLTRSEPLKHVSALTTSMMLSPLIIPSFQVK